MKRWLSLFVAFIMAACSNSSQQSDAYGNFEATETIVSAESPGRVLEMNVEQGDKVKKNQLIALTDTSQIYFGLEQLKAQKEATLVKKINVKAQIKVLEEQLKNLQIDQERIHRLFADKAATKKDLDFIDGKVSEMQKQIASVQTQFLLIDREMEVLDTQIAKNEDLKAKCRMVSPVDGTVLEKYMEQGEMAVAGKPVVKIADLSRLDLRVFVSGDQLSEVKIGQEVVVVIDKNKTENHTLTGKVTWVSPEAEFTPKIIQTKEERVKLVYAVKVSVKNDGRLKIGMPGEIRLMIDDL